MAFAFVSFITTKMDRVFLLTPVPLVARHPEVDLYPAELRTEIEAFYVSVYEPLLNGVYRAG